MFTVFCKTLGCVINIQGQKCSVECVTVDVIRIVFSCCRFKQTFSMVIDCPC